MLKSIFQPLIAWYLAALKTAGYPVIVLLMTMESSVLPIPSEAIIPPAAYLAWFEGIKFFNFHFVGWSAEIGLVMAGMLGSWLGATIVYWLARVAGRPLVVRYGRFVLFPPEKLKKAESWSAFPPVSRGWTTSYFLFLPCSARESGARCCATLA